MHAPGEPVLVRADPVRLGTVCATLLRHAARYAPASAVDVGVQALPDGALLTVRMRGVESDADRSAEVFEPFGDAARGDGNGLAMYVVRALVVASGGMVGMAGTAGSDGTPAATVLWARLPLADPPAGAAGPHGPPPRPHLRAGPRCPPRPAPRSPHRPAPHCPPRPAPHRSPRPAPHRSPRPAPHRSPRPAPHPVPEGPPMTSTRTGTWTLACGDVIPGCSSVVTGTTRDAVLASVGAHAAADHGVTALDDATTSAVAGRPPRPGVARPGPHLRRVR